MARRHWLSSVVLWLCKLNRDGFCPSCAGMNRLSISSSHEDLSFRFIRRFAIIGVHSLFGQLRQRLIHFFTDVFPLVPSCRLLIKFHKTQILIVMENSSKEFGIRYTGNLIYYGQNEFLVVLVVVNRKRYFILG